VYNLASKKAGTYFTA